MKIYRSVGEVQAAIQGLASAADINLVEITPAIQAVIDGGAPKDAASRKATKPKRVFTADA